MLIKYSLSIFSLLDIKSSYGSILRYDPCNERSICLLNQGFIHGGEHGPQHHPPQRLVQTSRSGPQWRRNDLSNCHFLGDHASADFLSRLVASTDRILDPPVTISPRAPVNWGEFSRPDYYNNLCWRFHSFLGMGN